MPEQPILPSPRLPKEQILKLLREISGVEVVWSTGARGLLGYQPSSERAWLLANVQGWRELGTDELRVVWNPARNANDEMLVGQRTFTLALQAFSVDPEIEAFDLLEARVNCEQNSLLYLVRPRRGGICHTKNRQGAPRNCYDRRIDLDTRALENLDP